MSFSTTPLVGFGGRRSSAIPSVTYITDTSDNGAATTTRTFSTISFGAAVTGRRIVVGYAGYIASGTPTISSITIGGTSATIAAQAQGGGNNVIMGMACAQVDSGTTGDIVITTSSNTQYHTIAVWRVVDLTNTTAHGSGATTGSTASQSINVPANGIVLAFAHTHDGSPTAPSSWSGVTSDGTRTNGGTSASAFASQFYAAAQTGLTVSVTVPGSRSGLVVASYGN